MVSIACCLAACGSTAGDAEQEIRAWLDSGQQAAEEKDRRTLVSMISPDYADRQGNDRAAIEKLLIYYFLRQNNITLLTRVEDLQVFDNTAAEVRMTVGMAGSDASALGFSAEAYRFLLELERDDDDWLLVAARWARLNEDL